VSTTPEPIAARRLQITTVPQRCTFARQVAKPLLSTLCELSNPEGRPLDVFRRTALHDFLHAGGFRVLGAAIAASINVLLPQRYLDQLAGKPAVAVLTLAVLAAAVSICSEADAFVASSLTAFSPMAQWSS
jgi:uncharacterized membrane protein YraQ (UPF0718 family)